MFLLDHYIMAEPKVCAHTILTISFFFLGGGGTLIIGLIAKVELPNSKILILKAYNYRSRFYY